MVISTRVKKSKRIISKKGTIFCRKAHNRKKRRSNRKDFEDIRRLYNVANDISTLGEFQRIAKTKDSNKIRDFVIEQAMNNSIPHIQAIQIAKIVMNRLAKKSKAF